MMVVSSTLGTEVGTELALRFGIKDDNAVGSTFYTELCTELGSRLGIRDDNTVGSILGTSTEVEIALGEKLRKIIGSRSWYLYTPLRFKHGLSPCDQTLQCSVI